MPENTTTPTPPGKIRIVWSVAIALAAGLLVSVGLTFLALLIEDPTSRTVAEVLVRLTGAFVSGVVFAMAKRSLWDEPMEAVRKAQYEEARRAQEAALQRLRMEANLRQQEVERLSAEYLFGSENAIR